MQFIKNLTICGALTLLLSACLHDDSNSTSALEFDKQQDARSHFIASLNENLYFTSPHTQQLISWNKKTKTSNWKKDIGQGGATVSVDVGNDRVFSAATDAGVVYVHNLQGELINTLESVQQPVGVLWLENLKHLLVSDQALNQIIVFDENLAELSRINVQGSPRGLAYSAQTQKLLVTCFLSDQFAAMDVTDQISGGETHLSLSNVQYQSVNFKARLAQNIELYEQQVLIPHTQSNHEKTNLVFDGIVAPRVSAFNLSDLKFDSSRVIAIDTLDRTVNQPNDLMVDSQTGNRWVVNSGSNDISVFSDAPSKFVAHIDVAKKPNGIWLDVPERKAYVLNTLSYSISEIDMDSFTVLAQHPVTEQIVSDSIQLGMEVFFLATDTRVAKDAWVTCAICHPDGKQDGLVWQQGLGPRNTTTMQGLAHTGQLHWSGNRDEIQDFEHTFLNLMAGTGFVDNPPPELGAPISGASAELDGLSDFILSLNFAKPLKPEFLDEGAVERGKVIFESAQTACNTCHLGEHFTQSVSGVQDLDHVGTQTRADDIIELSQYDTPSLKGLAFSAPYLHDGSASSLLKVINEFNSQDQHGVTSHLTATEQADLVAYMNSL